MKDRFQKFVQNNESEQLIVADVALLFESNFETFLDYTLLISCDKAKRIERAQARGNLTEEQIKKRMALQMPEDEKRKRASFVIKNNGTKLELRKKVAGLYKNLMKLD